MLADPILQEWGGLLIRWLHVVAGIAWIGSSFYFMHLDAALRPVPDAPNGQTLASTKPYGAAWEVHGGGFYEVNKYLAAPAHLPEHLIWHKWQAYATWLSGFGLLIWVYYLNADLYLIDSAVMVLTPFQAACIGLASLVLGWVVYSGLCRSPLSQNEVALSAALFVFIVAMAWGFAQVFSGRGAFIHVGAVMGTIMSANVFMVIIPGQKKIIASLLAGHAPDPALGMRAKIRSKHNNYITLPVLFLMLSGHYPMTWSTPYSFVIVGLMLVAGAVVRHFYNVRHASHGTAGHGTAGHGTAGHGTAGFQNAWWCWAVAMLCVWLSVWISMAASPLGRERLGLSALVEPVMLAVQPQAPRHVAEIVASRCSMCHALEPAWPGIAIAPKGVRLDTAQQIQRQQHAIYMQSVASLAMPPGNVSGMTREERLALARWVAGR